MVDLDTVDNDPRKGDIGFIGKHRCSCCGYVCKHEYLKDVGTDWKTRTPSSAAELLMAQVDEMVRAGMRVGEIAEELDTNVEALRRRLRYNGYDMNKVRVKRKQDKFAEQYTELKNMGLSTQQIADKLELSHGYVHDRSLKLGLREPLPHGRK